MSYNYPYPAADRHTPSPVGESRPPSRRSQSPVDQGVDRDSTKIASKTGAVELLATSTDGKLSLFQRSPTKEEDDPFVLRQAQHERCVSPSDTRALGGSTAGGGY